MEKYIYGVVFAVALVTAIGLLVPGIQESWNRWKERDDHS